MKRRPHWTDDLIEAVKDAISGWCFDHVEGPLYDEDVYPVIAAVEDWHKAKRDSRDRTHSAECWRWHQECAEHLIERQRSTAQRVREACEPFGPMGSIAVWRVLRALDGDNDA
mgnify:CR=1 FL=1